VLPTDIRILALWTNDAAYGKRQGFPERYDRLMQALGPTGLSILTTIPLSNQRNLWEDIRVMNQSIREIAKNRGSRIVEWETSLHPNPLELSPFYPWNDPLHPTNQGYEIWGEALRIDIIRN